VRSAIYAILPKNDRFPHALPTFLCVRAVGPNVSWYNLLISDPPRHSDLSSARDRATFSMCEISLSTEENEMTPQQSRQRSGRQQRASSGGEDAQLGAALRPLVEGIVSDQVGKISKELKNSLTPLEQEVRKRLDGMNQVIQEMRQAAETQVAEVVHQIVSEKIAELPPQTLEIVVNDRSPQRLERQHYLFEVALRMMSAKDLRGAPVNLALVGPTQTGKSTMAVNAAKALGLDIVVQPFNQQTSKSELMGYMSASGTFVQSPFYKAFKEGLVFLAEEWDAASPATALILNTATSNRMVTFPNGETVNAHKNFRIVYSMNTFGTGPDDRYTGRTRLDLSTLERAVTLYVPPDPGLEAALVGVASKASPKANITAGGRFRSNKQILDTIDEIRDAVGKLGLRYEITPKATIHAVALHEAGFGRDVILESCVWKGMPTVTRDKIKTRVATIK
jgi:cobaltochelatase CobS